MIQQYKPVVLLLYINNNAFLNSITDAFSAIFHIIAMHFTFVDARDLFNIKLQKITFYYFGFHTTCHLLWPFIINSNTSGLKLTEFITLQITMKDI